ncbi:NAD(P)H-flavin reductase [Candidatus Methylobacter favarea]|uniref:NAD(P)H-flavin reductase n=2 Tax=Candidatus Methylobacter favarea TaxID=2707345 RepID=A0A8S0X8T3_9GAMM|nr:NAD(P)H-flavin reductase [Candidatus Methylobacter favarea]
MRSLDNAPPASAQAGLKDTLQQQNYFPACLCRPEQNMTVQMPNQQGIWIQANVVKKQWLSPDILRLVLEYETKFNFFVGQLINLKRPDGLIRSYSIANIPHHENILEFHIRRLPDGQFSTWAHDELEIGMELTISQAQGSCHYLPGRAEQPLLLAGTGSGLAPLWGIVTDALVKGHSGPIHLFHGSRDPDGLYLRDEMREMAMEFENFRYTPCLSGDTAAADYARGRAYEVALSSAQSLKGWRVYLCGHPEMVKQTRKMVYLKGASMNDIYADAFHVNPAEK